MRDLILKCDQNGPNDLFSFDFLSKQNDPVFCHYAIWSKSRQISSL